MSGSILRELELLPFFNVEEGIPGPWAPQP